MRRIDHTKLSRRSQQDVALNQPVASAETHIIRRAVCGCELRMPERPRARIAVFRAARSHPARTRVGVGRRFFQLVRHHRNRAVYSGISVRADRLRRARTQAAIRVADERISNPSVRVQRRSGRSMPAAPRLFGCVDCGGGGNLILAYEKKRDR